MRTKARRGWVLLGAAAAALLFTACADSSGKNDANTLTISTGSHNSDTSLVARVIQEKFPEIHFEVDAYTGANATTYLSEKISHGDESDIFVYTNKLPDEISSEHLLDLSGYPFVGNYDGGILENLDVNGKIYQLSGPITINAMLINKTLFEEHGWNIPKNHEELVALCKQIRKESPDIVPIALGTKGPAMPFMVVGAFSQCGFLNTPEGVAWEKKYQEGKASIGEGLDEGLDMISELINAGAFEAEPYEELWTPGISNVGNRKCAMGYVVSRMSDYIPFLDGTAAENKEEYGEYADDEFELLPFFGSEPGKEGIDVYMSVAFSVSKRLEEKGNEKKLENALKVMEYLSTEEAQQKLKTNEGQLPVVGGSGSAPKYYQRLWDLGDYGAKRFYLYSGYEDIVVDCGEMIKDAIREQNADGLKERFIETADRLHQETLTGQSDSAYGMVAEDLTSEETVQVMRDAVQAAGDWDLTLATHGTEIDSIMNHEGEPTGFAGKWFKGPLSEVVMNVALGNLGEKIVTVDLTGAEIKDLLEKGSIRRSADGERTATFYYGWSGIDVDTIKDETSYKVAFPFNDYSQEFEESHEITDTGLLAIDAAKQYVKAMSPIKAPEVHSSHAGEPD